MTLSRRAASPFIASPLAGPLQARAIAARLAVLGGLAGAALAAPAAWAQAVAVAAPATVHADVPAGPLADALARFARQAGVRLQVREDLVKGRTSSGLAGDVGVEDGLRRLLAGSGLHAAATASGYVLATADVPTPSEGNTLQTVTVSANQLGDVTEGSGSYTPGSIATATRLVLTPRETPQSISVITRQQMDDFNLTSIDQVMAQTPGISIVTYDSERTEYYARGFAIQNFQYDGIPMTRDSSYSAGNTLSDTVIYDRIEVLKGATGLLTGSGTPGATINLIRKKPSLAFQGHATAGVDNWGSYRGEVDVGGALNETGSLRARGVMAYQQKKTQTERYRRATEVFYGVVEADVAPDTLLTIGADYQDSKPHGSSWGGIPLFDTTGAFDAMPRSFNNGTNWSRWNQSTRTSFATLEHQFDDGWVAKAQFNHQINGYDANLGGAGAGLPDPATGTGVSLWVGQYIGHTTSDALDVYASGPFKLLGRKHELVIGGSVAKRRWKNSGWWYTDPSYDFDLPDYYDWHGDVAAPAWAATPDFTNDETTREQGLYTAVRWNLGDAYKLITGGRVSNYRNDAQALRETGVFVPYVGLVADVSKAWSVYGSYTGIFSPQSNQDEEGRTLAPLKGKNYELGAKGALFGGRLNASAAVFQLMQDNYAIATGGLTPTGGTAYRAAQGVRTTGYEAELSGQVARDWQVQGGFSHSVSREQGVRVSTLNPVNQFTLNASHKLTGSVPGLLLGGGARWQDKTGADVSAPSGTVRYTVHGYWLFDAVAHYEFDKHVSASLNVDNLFDKKYITLFNWYSTYTWGAGRTASASVTYKF